MTMMRARAPVATRLPGAAAPAIAKAATVMSSDAADDHRLATQSAPAVRATQSGELRSMQCHPAPGEAVQHLEQVGLEHCGRTRTTHLLNRVADADGAARLDQPRRDRRRTAR